MAKIHQGFKVVSTYFRITSSVFNVPPEEIHESFCSQLEVRVRYFPGSWTVRPVNCGPLACFTNLQDATNWLGYYRKYISLPGHVTIFACEYKKSRAKSLWLRDRYKHKWRRPLIGLPPGTVLADSIKLTLKVARG